MAANEEIVKNAPSPTLTQVLAGTDGVNDELEGLKQRLESMPAEIRRSLEALEHEIDEFAAEVTAVAQRAVQDEAAILACVGELSEQMEQSLAQMDGALNETTHAANTLVQTCADADEQLNQLLTTLTTDGNVSSALAKTLADSLKSTVHDAEPRWAMDIDNFLRATHTAAAEHLQQSSQLFEQLRTELSSHYLQAVSAEIERTVEGFADTLGSTGDKLSSDVSSQIDSHIDVQAEQIKGIIETIKQVSGRIQSVVAAVSRVVEGGVQSTHTITEAMGTTNTGLQVTVGTVVKMKGVLERLV